MRNPEIVLNTLCQHSKVSDYKFERLYRILFNKEMFFIAYQRIYAKPGNMTPGTDGQTIDQMSIGRIERLIETLRNESYKPHPAKRVYIPKKNGKKRPLGIPVSYTHLVQVRGRASHGSSERIQPSRPLPITSGQKRHRRSLQRSVSARVCSAAKAMCSRDSVRKQRRFHPKRTHSWPKPTESYRKRYRL